MTGARVSLRAAAVAAVLWVALPATPARAEESVADAGTFDAAALLRHAASNLGAGRTFIAATLTLPRSRLSRSRDVRFRLFEDRPRQRSLLEISDPAKHAGTRYLWLSPVAWIRVPGDHGIRLLDPAQLSSRWMDCDFTLSDLLRRGREAHQANSRLLRVDRSGEGGRGGPVAVIESVAADATGSNGARIIHWIEVEHGIPLRREFLDSKGEVARVLRYSDVREVSGHFVPHSWEMAPDGERKRVSRIAIETIRFGADFEEAVFTTDHLTSGN